MSNSDSFIDEVTEEVRRERLFKVFRRYGWIALVVVLGIVGGAVWTEWQKSKRTAASQAFGDAVLTALDAPEGASRATALMTIEAPDPQAAAVARLLAANEAAATGTAAGRTAALDALDAVARDLALDPVWRDLAALRHIKLSGDDLAPDARHAALLALTEPGRPYRVLALEQIALGHADSGDVAQAISVLEALVSDQDAPAGLRNRVAQVLFVLEAQMSATAASDIGTAGDR